MDAIYIYIWILTKRKASDNYRLLPNLSDEKNLNRSD